MPELAEVEVARRNLEAWWTGRAAQRVVVLDARALRAPDDARAIEGMQRPVERVVRRGKYLIVEFEGISSWALIHFRMTGKIIRDQTGDARFARVAWMLEPDEWLVFKDQRCLGGVDWIEAPRWTQHPTFLAMGPEPDDWEPADVMALQGSRATLKAKLLDQSVVAGIGNIAVCEIFWRLRVAPDLTCAELDADTARALVLETRAYFNWLIAHERGPEITYVQEDASAHPFSVYAREGEPCERCQGTIARIKVAGRSSYYCPVCQGR